MERQAINYMSGPTPTSERFTAALQHYAGLWTGCQTLNGRIHNTCQADVMSFPVNKSIQEITIMIQCCPQSH
eukprot:637767-Amphidinium_carterae.1